MIIAFLQQIEHFFILMSLQLNVRKSGIIMSLATLIIGFINSRKSGKSFNIIRRVQGYEGIGEYQGLFGQSLVMMLFVRFGGSMYNTALCKQFFTMFNKLDANLLILATGRIIPFFVMVNSFGTNQISNDRE